MNERQEGKHIIIPQASLELAKARGLPETIRSYNKEVLMRLLLENVPVELLDNLDVNDVDEEGLTMDTLNDSTGTSTLCRDKACSPPYGDKSDCEFYLDGKCTAKPRVQDNVNKVLVVKE